jgi:hypothetical protein
LTASTGAIINGRHKHVVEEWVMTRWLILLALLMSNAGCALFDEYDFGPPMHAHHYEGVAPANTCSAPVVVNSHQTQEPPR